MVNALIPHLPAGIWYLPEHAYIVITLPAIRWAIHYQFEAIHPFVDENGRIGRLLLSLLLVGWNLLPLPLLHLSAYIEPHRQEYYDLLLAVSQQGAWRDWILFFLQAISTQAQDTGERIKKIQDLQRVWREKLVQSKAATSVFRLADCAAVMPISMGARLRYTLDRDSQAYKDVYKQRTAVERINSQAKALGIERPILRNGAAITNLNTRIFILINLRLLQRIRNRQSAID